MTIDKMKVSEETKERLSLGYDLIVSVSGGKDSTATCLRLFEMGYAPDDFRRVFMDTGWESAETYRYLNELEKTVGTIERIRRYEKIDDLPEMAQSMILELEQDLGRESDFVRKVFRSKFFPSSFMKYCTKALKIDPISKLFNECENDFINVIGVRRAESKARSEVTEWEYNDGFDCWVWRPLYLWTEEDVISIHQRFGVAPNRMYLNGSARVGCYPCIYARKGEIKNLDADRVAFIAKFERYMGEYVKTHWLSEKAQAIQASNFEEHGFYFQPFFKKPCRPIELHYEWAQGKPDLQLKLFDIETEEPSCSKWGMCDLSGEMAKSLHKIDKTDRV